jgi:isopenicillin-N N-acyltransferase-like protein
MLDEINLKGNFFEMGEQLGKARAKHIQSFCKMSFFMASISKKPGSQTFNPNLWYILPTLLTYRRDKRAWREWASQYEQVISVYQPDAIEFMKGVANGSQIPYDDILFFNVVTESILTCSIWGASGSSTKTGEPFIGMNADEEPMAAKYEAFLDIQPDTGYRYKVTAFAGWSAFNHGMNEKGLALASTLLFLKPPEQKVIRPPSFVLMKALNTCASVEEAKAFFESVPNVAVGMVFYLADAEKFMRVECTPAKRIYEVVENGALGNANMVMNEELKPYDAVPELKQSFNAIPRTKRMQKLLDRYNGAIDEDVMRAIASDHGAASDGTQGKSICQHAKPLRYNFQTLVSFIAKPKEKCFWITEGCPCRGNTKKHGFQEE